MQGAKEKSAIKEGRRSQDSPVEEEAAAVTGAAAAKIAVVLGEASRRWLVGCWPW